MNINAIKYKQNLIEQQLAQFQIANAPNKVDIKNVFTFDNQFLSNEADMD